MKRKNWLLTGAAALFLGCGGDTASTKSTKTTTSPPDKPVDASAMHEAKPKEAVKLPPADVPEPPPPKSVTDKDKDKKPAPSTDEPKAPKPVEKKGK